MMTLDDIVSLIVHESGYRHDLVKAHAKFLVDKINSDEAFFAGESVDPQAVPESLSAMLAVMITHNVKHVDLDAQTSAG